MKSPQDFQNSKNESIDKLIQEIDEKLDFKTSNPTLSDHVDIIISGEYSKQVRDEIVKCYMKFDWKNITHKTSSENGERPGLTLFSFYF